MTKARLTKTQQDLFGKIESELRKQCALCYIESGYENKTHSYLEACRILNKKPSKNPVTSGAEILNYPSVTAFINSVQCNVAEATQINAQYVLNRLKEIDELDILDIMNEELDGFKRLSEWPKSWRTSISGIDIQTMISGGEQEPIEKVIKKIKWPDKTKNLELIGRHVNVKAWEKEQEQTNVIHNIMPVPTADSVESWEESAKANQKELLKHD